MIEVQYIECVNNAAFVMSFGIQILDENTGLILIVDGLDTGNYPIGQSRRINLATIGIEPGTVVRPQVRAVWGVNNPGDEWVRFQPNRFLAKYDVRGTTLSYTVRRFPEIWLDLRPHDVEVEEVDEREKRTSQV